ncbi:MAG: enoyl-CoA hydratase [Gammaproteobacteria bacterium]|nr:enoyl-CoA hydratase [Gammaproteobacteria bacterium]
MATDKMLAEKSGAVGRMIFNNPQRHNAISLEMWIACETILDDFLGDDAIRVILMSGAGGKAFVSGADISDLDRRRSDADVAAEYNARIKAIYQRLNQSAKPTIAVIDGYCLGGGLALAVACDLRFCSEKSRFGLPAARLGLGYPFDGTKRLVDTLGPGAAKDIIFSARQLDAGEAFTIGLVQKVLPEQDLEPFVNDYARSIARNAPLTVKATKLIIGEVLKDPGERDLALCQRLLDDCFASSDYAEGRRAFAEKREPEFKGQ